MLAVQCLTVLLCGLVPASLSNNVYDRETFFQKRNMRQRIRELQDMFGRQNLSGVPNRNSTYFSRFIPTPPPSDMVDCYVEVEEIRTLGGRCVRLSGLRQMAVCQSGMYLDVQNTECESLLNRREMNSDAASGNSDTGNSGDNNVQNGN